MRLVADDSRNLNFKALSPALLIRSFNNGRHVGASARNQNHNVFHTGIIPARAR
jgi:hypothetical protein